MGQKRRGDAGRRRKHQEPGFKPRWSAELWSDDTLPAIKFVVVAYSDRLPGQLQAIQNASYFTVEASLSEDLIAPSIAGYIQFSLMDVRGVG